MSREKAGGTDISLPPVRIEKLVHGGAGLGFAGAPVFIPLTAPGDLVEPSEVRRARGVFFAEPGRLLELSECRIDPPCPWFGECGGCLWMHMGYRDQVQWKGTVAEETFRRIGRIERTGLDALHASPFERGYRWRARLHVEQGRAGFFRRRSAAVVQWERCLLLPDRVNAAVTALRSILASGAFPAGLRSVETAMSPADGGLTLKWDLAEGPVDRNGLGKAAVAAEKGLAASGFDVQGQVFAGPGGRQWASGGGALALDVAGAALRASPGAFFQVNPRVNDLLVGRVLDLLERYAAGSLLDLYCGNGNFGVPAATRGIRVEGVDANPSGIKDAEAAGGSGRFHAMDVERYLDSGRGRWDAVIVDPPRAGLTRNLVRRLLALKPPVLVYVSCEPATLARDLALLIEGGYVLKDAELFDMFPQTPHAEVMAVLEHPTR